MHLTRKNKKFHFWNLSLSPSLYLSIYLYLSLFPVFYFSSIFLYSDIKGLEVLGRGIFTKPSK